MLAGKVRRKIGKWSNEETEMLINLVRRYGKGNWKMILDKALGGLGARSQVGAPLSILYSYN